MDARKITFGGKTYLVSTNNSGELSNKDIAKPENQKYLKANYPELDLTNGGYTPELIKIILARPHTGRSSNGKLQIKDDAVPARTLTLGMKTLTGEENVVDRKGAVSAPEGFWLAVSQALEAKKDAPQEFKDFAKAQLSSSISVEELIKKVSLEDLLSLMK